MRTSTPPQPGLVLAMTVAAALFACRHEAAPQAAMPHTGAMSISSAAFAPNGAIPAPFTCDGSSRIPPLSFSGVPPTAKSLALVVDDPDAPGGTWDHWVVWNIPPVQTGTSTRGTLPGVVGRNSWKRNQWGAPCPPNGSHRYVFKLYALDTTLALGVDSGSAELQHAMSGHVLDTAQLVGVYARGSR